MPSLHGFKGLLLLCHVKTFLNVISSVNQTLHNPIRHFSYQGTEFPNVLLRSVLPEKKAYIPGDGRSEMNLTAVYWPLGYRILLS